MQNVFHLQSQIYIGKMFLRAILSWSEKKKKGIPQIN